MLMYFDGQPLIKNVYEKVKSFGYDTFVVTDSEEIAQHIPWRDVIMTGEAENGTYRIALADLDYDYIINVQGDMLDIEYDHVHSLVHEALYNDFDVMTLYTKGAKDDDVKVIHRNGCVNWFTRGNLGYGDRHLGVYAYSKRAIKSYPLLKCYHPEEDLEQLRWLTTFDVYALEITYNGREINTEADTHSRYL